MFQTKGADNIRTHFMLVTFFFRIVPFLRCGEI